MIPGNHLQDNSFMTPQKVEEGEVVSLSSPRLNALEKLYVRTYLSTLSHIKAHEAVSPGLVKYKSENPYSTRENVKFHISLKLQEQAEALSLTPDIIISQLYKEATREGNGSNHAARIQALQILGKHLGLFTEKKADVSHTIQIINYGGEVLLSNEVEQVEEEIEETYSLPDGIEIENYD
jgi:hypothetical protein